MQHQATYSPEDNKLRLYPAYRLDSEEYERVKNAGFKWAPRQELFVAPMWTPQREDFATEFCDGEIGDEDTSLVERAEERAERFQDYGESRAKDADSAHKAVSAIADNIPLGQPILVGHHSEKRARKDAEKIQNGMRRAVKMWETSAYWTDRAAGAIRHAKYLERSDVRARRIKKLEAAKRKAEKSIAESSNFTALWEADGLTMERALGIANFDHCSKCFTLAEYPREPPVSQYEGMTSLWSALKDGIITPEQAREIAVRIHKRSSEHSRRWVAHYRNRLLYERAMLGESGGTAADRTKPEKGGACKCWVFRSGWVYIQRVNKVSVTVHHTYNEGGRVFRQTVPFDKLAELMTADQVQAARDDGRLVESNDKTGFFLSGDVPYDQVEASRWPAM